MSKCASNPPPSSYVCSLILSKTYPPITTQRYGKKWSLRQVISVSWYVWLWIFTWYIQENLYTVMTTALFFITLQQMLHKVKWSVWVHRTLWQFMNSNIKYAFCRIIYIYLLIFCLIGGRRMGVQGGGELSKSTDHPFKHCVVTIASRPTKRCGVLLFPW